MRSDQRGKPAQTPEIVVVRPEQAPLHRITIWRALQLPIATWHEVIGEPTLGDAILDRIVHNAYRLELDGPSMRKLKVSEATLPPAPATPAAADRKPPKGAKT